MEEKKYTFAEDDLKDRLRAIIGVVLLDAMIADKTRPDPENFVDALSQKLFLIFTNI